LQIGCYGAVLEGINEFMNYYNGYTDIFEFTDTFAYNFGFMYDSIVSAY